MKRVSAKIWSAIGWVAIALVVVSIPYFLVDGVMGMAVMFLATVVGGLSGVGLKSTARFGVATILACLALTMMFVGISDTTSSGIQAPQLTLVANALLTLAIPVLIAAGLLFIGAVRRRRSANLSSAPPRAA